MLISLIIINLLVLSLKERPLIISKKEVEDSLMIPSAPIDGVTKWTSSYGDLSSISKCHHLLVDKVVELDKLFADIRKSLTDNRRTIKHLMFYGDTRIYLEKRKFGITNLITIFANHNSFSAQILLRAG